MNDEQHNYLQQKHGQKSRQEKLENLIYMDGSIDIMCNFVANGGTLVNFAKLWDVRFSDIMKWIRSDKSRTEQYEAAIKDRNEFTVETILQELRNISTFDIRSIYDDSGCLKPVSEWPAHISSSISSIESNEIFKGNGDDRELVGMMKRVKMFDKTKAIEQLGKTQKLFTDKIETTNILKLEDLVLASFKDEQEIK